MTERASGARGERNASGGGLAVIGAGPIGLEAALGAVERGLEVTVLERARVGESLRRWGATRFFSPFAMNLSARAFEILGRDAPRSDALLTGPEMAELLDRIARRPPLLGRVRTGVEVRAVGRSRMTRGDRPGHPLRAERPFRLLVEGCEDEACLEVDYVLDASGSTTPAAAGEGGIPARGERKVGGRLMRHLGELFDRLPLLRGKRVLVIGHGHSAATALLALEGLAREHPGTRITWATRSMNKKPCREIASDPLPERRRVVERANALAMHPPPFLSIERRAGVLSFAEKEGAIEVELTGGRRDVFDEVAAFTGYRPDLGFLSELALEISPVSEGASRIHRALAGVTDCLAVPRIGAEDLASGEPGFHLVGHKSYGRMSTFLLKDGLAQVETILDALVGVREGAP